MVAVSSTLARSATSRRRRSEASVTPHFHPNPAPDPVAAEAASNPFLDKITARFMAAASALTEAAEALDGSDHVSAKGLDDLRWAASSVARSMDAVGAIATHFEQALLAPGGEDIDAPARSAGLQELHMRGLVVAALAGKKIA